MEDMTRLCSAAFLRLSSTDPWAQQCVQALTVALNFLDNDWLKQQVSDFSLRMEAGQVEDALQHSVAQLQINIDVQGPEDVVNKLSASADVDPQLIVKARALFEKVVGYAVNEGIRLLESADAEIQKGWVAISFFCQAVGLGTDHAAWTQVFNNMAGVVKSSIALCQAAPQRDHATDTLQDVLVPLDPFLVPLCKAIKGMKVALATVQVSTTDSVNLLETFKTKAWPLAMEIVHHRVEMPIRSTLQALCDDAVQNTRELKRVCGGNPTGGNWSAKRPESTPILDWAQTTLVALTKVDSQNMATFSTSATEANNLRSIHKKKSVTSTKQNNEATLQAQNRLQTALATYKEVFPGKTFKVDLSPEHRTLLDGIPGDCVTAQVTKVEYLVAMTLKSMQEGSPSPQEIEKSLARMDTYTANVASQAKKPWTQVIHPEFVKAIVASKKAGANKNAEEVQDLAALTRLAEEVADKDKKDKSDKKDKKDKSEKKDKKDKSEKKDKKEKAAGPAAAPGPAKRQKKS